MLIAISLMLTAIVPLAVLLSTGLKTTVTTTTRMYARQLAANEIDKIKGLHFEAVGLSDGLSTFNPAANGQSLRPENGFGTGVLPQETVVTYSGNSYTVTRDIHKLVNSTRPNAATKEVIVTVSWTSPLPGDQVQLSTLMGMTDMPAS